MGHFRSHGRLMVGRTNRQGERRFDALFSAPGIGAYVTFLNEMNTRDVCHTVGTQCRHWRGQKTFGLSGVGITNLERTKYTMTSFF